MSYKSVFSKGGSGIGRCTAHELAHLGANVALVGRKLDKLQAVKDEISESTGNASNCSIHSCDIRDEEKVAATVKSILSEHERIDGLVNNAGGQYPAPLALISKKGFDAVIANNLTGGFLFARECYNQYMGIHGGAIVNITADMWNGMPLMGHSGAARAGMLNFTETAALEWAPVRVNVVAPGYINSSGMDKYPEEVRAQLNQLKHTVPAHRLGTESEVSAAITFLLSPAAAFISGSTLRVDGAAPSAKRIWQLPVGNGTSTTSFNGFKYARDPDDINK